MSFERKNLAYIVRPTENKLDEMLHILKRMSGSAIVYVRSRQRTKEITDLLNKEGISADFYHAGLDNSVKDARQQKWQTDQCRVMVSTNAFGMGIDKPDVRLVIHIDMPDSPEAYFQEAGRAGRDGEKAYAVMLYAKTDKTTLRKRIPDTFPEKEYIKKVYEHLQYYNQMAMGDGQGCVKEFNLEEFCRTFKHFPVQAHSALKLLTQAGYIEYTDEQDNASRILFLVHRDDLYKLHGMSQEIDSVMQILLRTYTGLFTEYIYISEELIMQRTGYDRRQVYHILITLSKRRIIDYIPRKKTPYVIYTRERLDLDRIVITKAVYEERKERYENRINAMIEYADTDYACRSRMLLRYFGEKNECECGQCDVCIKRKKQGGASNQSVEDIRSKLMNLLKQSDQTPTELARLMNYEKDLLAEVIEYLLNEELIYMKDGKCSLQKS